MSGQGLPIGEDDLHAYVDGFLDPERRATVERYLADHPDAAARIAGWQAGGQALREALAWKAQEPVPARLNVARLAEARMTRRWTPWRIAAGIVLAFVLGSGSGWLARGGPEAPAGMMSVGMEAAAAYRVFATDHMHPVEFGADQKARLVSWVSQRLGRPVSPPDLSGSGYRLMGGRLLATRDGPACQFLYQDRQGTRITLFVRPMRKGGMNAQMRPVHMMDTAGFVWVRDGLGVSLLADKPMPVLHELSNQVRQEMSLGA
ncbi:MAG: anti-sigma factor family protein [Acetobacteraceae bacterium]